MMSPYLAAAVVLTIPAVTWAARLAFPRTTAKPAGPVFIELAPGTRWLVCDTTTCAHLTRPHVPQGDGAWMCTVCGHVTGVAS